MMMVATHDWCYYSNGTVFLMSTRIQGQESGEIDRREPLMRIGNYKSVCVCVLVFVFLYLCVWLGLCQLWTEVENRMLLFEWKKKRWATKWEEGLWLGSVCEENEENMNVYVNVIMSLIFAIFFLKRGISVSLWPCNALHFSGSCTTFNSWLLLYSFVAWFLKSSNLKILLK